MSDFFYRAFEDKFRGSRELILQRLRVYLPFIEPLVNNSLRPLAIDLGCGRGEWLEILSETGFEPLGVDLDAGMLQACNERGWRAVKADAIDYLKMQSDNSAWVISAFHVVEHLSFESLQSLISQSLRVLHPGGLLILETPNPENLLVSTQYFYLDPTHQRPLPSELLAFVLEYAGFSRVKTVRLQESIGLSPNHQLTLAEVLRGVSPDYAIIAQKAAPVDVLKLTDLAFSAHYGMSLESVVDRYDSGISQQFSQILGLAQQARLDAQTWRLNLDAVHASTSWRVTKPLRAIGVGFRFVRGALLGLKKKAKSVFNKVGQNRDNLMHPKWVKASILWLGNMPRVRRLAVLMANRYPKMGMRMRRIHLLSKLSVTNLGPSQLDVGKRHFSLPRHNMLVCGQDPVCDTSDPRAVGIHSKTPLESCFHFFRDQ